MDALLRRRAMIAAGGGEPPTPPGPTPVFYDWLVFDGTAYIDTDILLPENGTVNINCGYESQKVAQQIFSNGRTFVAINNSTTSVKRYFNVGYNSTSNIISGTTKGLEFTYTSYGLFLTPKRFGFGNSSVTFSKGNSPATIGFTFGSSAGHSGQSFTGRMGIVKVFDSSAQDATSANDLSNFTPVKTLRPCIYENEAGFWCVETSTFFGNTRSSGTLTVLNNS